MGDDMQELLAAKDKFNAKLKEYIDQGEANVLIIFNETFVVAVSDKNKENSLILPVVFDCIDQAIDYFFGMRFDFNMEIGVGHSLADLNAIDRGEKDLHLILTPEGNKKEINGALHSGMFHV